MSSLGGCVRAGWGASVDGGSTPDGTSSDKDQPGENMLFDLGADSDWGVGETSRSDGAGAAVPWVPQWGTGFVASSVGGERMAVDAAGNTYVTGCYSSVGGIFGATTLSNAGAFDVHVVKIDPQGDFVWVKRFGGGGDDRGQAIAVDGTGHVVISGYFSGTVSFGTTALTSAGSVDAYLVRLDALGEVVWAQRFGGSETVMGESLAADATGNITFAGVHYGTAQFGPSSFSSLGDRDGFLMRLDAAGNVDWTRAFGGAEREHVEGIALAGDGGVRVVGGFQADATFGSFAATNTGYIDGFVVAFDGGGSAQWLQTFGGAGSERGHDVAVDGSGDTWVTGSFEEGALFDGTPLSSAGANDAFVARYDRAGKLRWVRTFGDTYYEGGAAIAPDGRGGVLVAGTYRLSGGFGATLLPWDGFDDIFVMQLAGDGALRWVMGVGSPGTEEVGGLAYVAPNRAIVLGRFDGAGDFGGVSLAEKQNFVVTLDEP